MANYNSKKQSTEYTRSYENLRGVDLSERKGSADKHFSYLENMYFDYEAGNIQSIPGFRKLASLDGKINGIFERRKVGKEYIAVHAGKRLYCLNIENRNNADAFVSVYNGLADVKSSALALYEDLYILDGEKIIMLDKNGTASEITSDSPNIYIPITHINGVQNEPRNLLTKRFRQLVSIRSTDELSYGTDGLLYTVISFDERTCAASGCAETVSGELHIPSYTTIAGKSYRVTDILDNAFEGNTKITSLTTNKNLKRIGNRAFSGCTALTKVYLSSSVETIGDMSFHGCSSLSYFYIGDGFKSFGSSPLNMCTSLRSIYYSKEMADFEKISNNTEIEDRYVYYNALYKAIKLSIKLYGGVSKITSVLVNGQSIQYEFSSSTQNLIISSSSKDALFGYTLTVTGIFFDEGEGFLSTKEGQGLGGERSILECGLACTFDKKIFLAGNRHFPGIVFYSEDITKTDGKLYFSVYNYFIDAAANSPISKMLPLNNRLLIFSPGENGSGLIFCHTSSDTGNTVKYPLSFTRDGISLSGDTSVFMDEAVFASSGGIFSADASGGGVRVSLLSHNISRLLSSESPSEIRLAKWCGYLVASSGGRMYLADSRDCYNESGNTYYSWYFLSGIGTYRNDERVFKYSEFASENRLTHPKQGTPVYATVYSRMRPDGSMEYYTEEPEGSFSVYPTDEYRGGTFYPATELCNIGNLLFFGTECGDICLFNNDKRGVPPPNIRESDGFDPSEYQRKVGHLIHPYYHSFDRHGVKYVLATALDNCGIPNLEKSTVRGSLSVKFKTLSNAEITVLVKTDREKAHKLCKIHTGSLDFDTADFSRMSLDGAGYATVAVNEYERGWIEKQLILIANEFRAPIGIRSLAYRYKIKGKIRNK